MEWCSNHAAVETLANFLESCASIEQAVVCRMPTCRPDEVGRPTTARSRKQFKSTLVHDAVAAALSHKHHLIIHVGADPTQLVYDSHSQLAVELIHEQNLLFSQFFLRAFSLILLMTTSHF